MLIAVGTTGAIESGRELGSDVTAEAWMMPLEELRGLSEAVDGAGDGYIGL